MSYQPLDRVRLATHIGGGRYLGRWATVMRTYETKRGGRVKVCVQLDKPVPGLEPPDGLLYLELHEVEAVWPSQAKVAPNALEVARVQVGPGSLVGRTVETVEQPDPDASYVVVHFSDGATLYADDPSVYVSVHAEGLVEPLEVRHGS